MKMQMWTKAPPFPDMNEYKIIIHVSGGGRPTRPSPAECYGDAISDAFWELITRCWSQGPQDRPTMADVVTSISKDAPSLIVRTIDILL
jgi:hypothetical protein